MTNIEAEEYYNDFIKRKISYLLNGYFISSLSKRFETYL